MWVAPGQVIFSRRALINWNKCCPLIKIRHNVTNAVMLRALGQGCLNPRWMCGWTHKKTGHIRAYSLGLVRTWKDKELEPSLNIWLGVFTLPMEEGRRAKRAPAEPSEEGKLEKKLHHNSCSNSIHLSNSGNLGDPSRRSHLDLCTCQGKKKTVCCV